MLLLEADDALALFEDDVVPLAHSAVSLDLANGEVVLVAEANLVDPVLAGLDTYLSDGSVPVEHYLLITLVDA